MPARLDVEWSDSEDENASDVETSVLLGIPDGEIEEPLDLSDPTVSRIGGRPVFLPTQPLPASSAYCKLCAQAMPLLVQLWCPFEGSAMDRALYVWGCERPECQRKDGSIRAWRGIKLNRKYAAQLEKKKAKEAEKRARKVADESRKATEKTKQSVNPFSVSAGVATQVTFGLGTQLFGGDAPSLDKKGQVPEEPTSKPEPESDEETDEDNVESVTKQFESTTLENIVIPAEWSLSPCYRPLYLSTTSEYLPPPKSTVKPQDFPDEDVENKNSARDWGLEGWERAADVDGVFERFVKRISSENEQCVRYDLKGAPLPFGSRDKVYEHLFPPPPPSPFTTKPGFAAPIVQRRTYDASVIEACGACGSRRVFECQLMPNLINLFQAQCRHGKCGEERREPKKSLAAEERQTESERNLKGGMEWGTCFVFSCEMDCCAEGEEGWKEEIVLVQWDE